MLGCCFLGGLLGGEVIALTTATVSAISHMTSQVLMLSFELGLANHRFLEPVGSFGVVGFLSFCHLDLAQHFSRWVLSVVGGSGHGAMSS
jgi:hypothetical protein